MIKTPDPSTEGCGHVWGGGEKCANGKKVSERAILIHSQTCNELKMLLAVPSSGALCNLSAALILNTQHAHFAQHTGLLHTVPQNAA